MYNEELLEAIANYPLQDSDDLRIKIHNGISIYKYLEISFFIGMNNIALIAKETENNEFFIDNHYAIVYGNLYITYDKKENLEKLNQKIYSEMERIIITNVSLAVKKFEFIPESLRQKYKVLFTANELGIL